MIRPFLLTAVFVTALAAGAAASPVRVDRADDAGVTFVYAPGPMTRTIVDQDGAPAWQIAFEGTLTDAGPGDPVLPIRTERILLPPDGGYRLTFTTSGENRIEGARLFVATPSGDAPHNGFAPSVVTWDVQTFRGRRLLIVSMRPALYDADRNVLTTFERIDVRVEFAGSARKPVSGSFRPDPVMDSIWSGVLNAPPRDAGGGRPVLLPRAASKPGESSAIPPDYFDDAAEWYRMRVSRNGLFRLTGSDLAGAGASIAQIVPSSIRMFAGSGMALSETTPVGEAPGWGERGGFREIAIIVNESGAPNGRVDAADEILFYGLGPDNFRSWYDPDLPETWYEDETTNDNVYWLTFGGSFSGNPLRISEAFPASAGTAVSVVQEKIHFERNEPTLFDPLPREIGVRWEKWWWQRIEDNGSSFFWDLTLDHPDSTRPATLFTRWWGATWPKQVPDDPGRNHYMTVNVNGGPEKSAIWGGTIQSARYDMTIDDVIPKTVTRVIATVLRIPTPPNITRIDQVLLGWFEVTYWKGLSLSRQRLWFDGRSLDPGAATLRVEDTAAGSRFFDVTEPWAPVSVPHAVNGTSATFSVAEGRGRRFFGTTPAGYFAPAGLTRDVKPARWLRDPMNEADYLVIAWDDFMDAASLIADWRREHLRGITEQREDGAAPRPARTMAVRVTDIYDEFSGGRVDPTAIRNFIQYAYENWGNGGGDRLSYAFLIGDANRDTRNYENSNVPNYLPTWENGYDFVDDSTNPQYSADDFFGRLEGPADLFTDIIMGRLPVTSADEALALIRDKIIHAERFEGVNPNRGRAILAADDVCQGGRLEGLSTEHTRQTELLERFIPEEFDRRKIFLYDYDGDDCSVLFKPAAKRDLIVAINEGGWCVNYIGHGGDQQIADEKILEVPDVPSLNNRESLPILIAASCSVGKFDRSGSDGLAEVLVRSRTGGCIATIAATHLSYSTANGELNNLIFGKLFPFGDNRSVPVGKGLLDAKIAQIQIEGSFHSDRQKKYLILGDPASPLVTPNRRLQFTQFPDTLFRGMSATIAGDVLDENGAADSGYNGTLDLKVFDQFETRVASLGIPTNYTLPGATLFTGRTTVVDGHFTATFIVPASLRGGTSGRIRAYTAGPGGEAMGTVTPVPIVGTVAVGVDTIPPAITIRIPSQRATPGAGLEAIIEDESGINLTRLFEFRSVLMTMLDESEIERFRAEVTDQFEYESGSYQRGLLRTTIPDLPAGRYRIRITATDNFNNRGEGTLEVDLSAPSATGISAVYGIPNPFADQTEITYTLRESSSVHVSIFSVSGRKVREWSHDGLSGENRVLWDGLDQRGDAVANGVYLLRVSTRPAAGGKAQDQVEALVRLR